MSKDLKEGINPLVKPVKTQWNQIINILQDLKVEMSGAPIMSGTSLTKKPSN